MSMKKTLVFLLAICLFLGISSVALAADPIITKQPESATTSKKGTVSFTIKATGAKGITWRFVNPSTGVETTGKKLNTVFKKIKVSGANSQKITLKNVPEEMHGWYVYCHITGNGRDVDSDKVQLLVYGLPVPSDSQPSSDNPVIESTDQNDSKVTVEPILDGNVITNEDNICTLLELFPGIKNGMTRNDFVVILNSNDYIEQKGNGEMSRISCQKEYCGEIIDIDIQFKNGIIYSLYGVIPIEKLDSILQHYTKIYGKPVRTTIVNAIGGSVIGKIPEDKNGDIYAWLKKDCLITVSIQTGGIEYTYHDNAQTDASEIELGMTKDEVTAIMGKGSDTINKQFPTNYETIAYSGQTVSKFDDAILVLYFDNGILVSKMYTFDEQTTLRTENKYGYLLNALTNKYGEPDTEPDVTLFQNYFEMFTGKKVDAESANLLIKANYVVIKTWTINEDTTILLVNTISGKNEALTAIQYAPKGLTMVETIYNDNGL